MWDCHPANLNPNHHLEPTQALSALNKTWKLWQLTWVRALRKILTGYLFVFVTDYGNNTCAYGSSISGASGSSACPADGRSTRSASQARSASLSSSRSTRSTTRNSNAEGARTKDGPRKLVYPLTRTKDGPRKLGSSGSCSSGSCSSSFKSKFEERKFVDGAEDEHGAWKSGEEWCEARNFDPQFGFGDEGWEEYFEKGAEAVNIVDFERLHLEAVSKKNNLPTVFVNIGYDRKTGSSAQQVARPSWYAPFDGFEAPLCAFSFSKESGRLVPYDGM
jgi:hypothetical protein